jgi:hypothetical protein
MKRGRFPLMITVALTLTVFAVGAPAALADDQTPSSPTVSVILPLDATGCTGSFVGDQIENCVVILGDAAYLEEVQGVAFTNFGSVVGHEEITGPSIPNGHLNSPTQTINTSTGSPLIVWAPYGRVADGNYCAIFWQNVNGGYSENGPACEYVS